jgi:hypothetical protein
MKQETVDLGPIVEAKIHLVEERAGTRRELRNAVADEMQSGRQPAVIDRRQDRCEWLARGRPHREHLAGRVIVPVEELPTRGVAVHRFQRAQRPVEPGDRVIMADEPERLGDQRAPQVGADVRDGRLHAAGAIDMETVGRQPGRCLGHGDERRPRVLRIALQRLARVARIAGQRRGDRHGQDRQHPDQGQCAHSGYPLDTTSSLIVHGFRLLLLGYTCVPTHKRKNNHCPPGLCDLRVEKTL